jgi:hypothetical protein
VFGTPADATDEELTRFFRALQSVVDDCASVKARKRFDCLRSGLLKEWPKDSAWPETLRKASAVRDWVVASVAAGSSVLTRSPQS